MVGSHAMSVTAFGAATFRAATEWEAVARRVYAAGGDEARDNDHEDERDADESERTTEAQRGHGAHTCEWQHDSERECP